MPKTYSQDIKERLFTDIDDLSILDYWRITSKEDYSILIKPGKSATEGEQGAAWKVICFDIIEEKLKDPSFVREFEQKIKQNYLYASSYLSNNVATFSRLRNNKNKEKSEKENKDVFNLVESILAIHKSLGLQIDEKTTSVRKYLSYIGELNRVGEKAFAEANKRSRKNGRK